MHYILFYCFICSVLKKNSKQWGSHYAIDQS